MRKRITKEEAELRRQNDKIILAKESNICPVCNKYKPHKASWCPLPPTQILICGDCFCRSMVMKGDKCIH